MGSVRRLYPHDQTENRNRERNFQAFPSSWSSSAHFPRSHTNLLRPAMVRDHQNTRTILRVPVYFILKSQSNNSCSFISEITSFYPLKESAVGIKAFSTEFEKAYTLTQSSPRNPINDRLRLLNRRLRKVGPGHSRSQLTFLGLKGHQSLNRDFNIPPLAHTTLHVSSHPYIVTATLPIYFILLIITTTVVSDKAYAQGHAAHAPPHGLRLEGKPAHPLVALAAY